MIKFIKTLCIIIFLLVPVFGRKCIASDSTETKKRLHTKVLPVLFYTPETRIAGGILGYCIFRTSNKDTATNLSNIQLYLDYTQNRQHAIQLPWYILARKNKYVFEGEFVYIRFPEFVFGIGNNTLKENKELYSFDMIQLFSKNMIQFKKRFFGGLKYNFQTLYDVSMEDSGMMASHTIPGAEGYMIGGLGPSFLYDSRDNTLNTEKGSYISIDNLWYNQFMLNSYRYSEVVADVRKFIGWGKRHVLALNYYSHFTWGEVPFRAMPYIGGARFMRGFYRGRFRDKKFIFLETENRTKLFPRLGLALFAGLGHISSSLNNVDLLDIKYHAGLGLRFQISKSNKANLRLDYGFTKEGGGLYIVFAEAF